MTKRLTSELRQSENSLSSIVALLESTKREVESLKKEQAEVCELWLALRRDVQAHREFIYFHLPVPYCNLSDVDVLACEGSIGGSEGWSARDERSSGSLERVSQ
jgi:hypothetical protein